MNSFDTLTFSGEILHDVIYFLELTIIDIGSTVSNKPNIWITWSWASFVCCFFSLPLDISGNRWLNGEYLVYNNWVPVWSCSFWQAFGKEKDPPNLIWNWVLQYMHVCLPPGCDFVFSPVYTCKSIPPGFEVGFRFQTLKVMVDFQFTLVLGCSPSGIMACQLRIWDVIGYLFLGSPET